MTEHSTSRWEERLMAQVFHDIRERASMGNPRKYHKFPGGGGARSGTENATTIFLENLLTCIDDAIAGKRIRGQVNAKDYRQILGNRLRTMGWSTFAEKQRILRNTKTRIEDALKQMNPPTE